MNKSATLPEWIIKRAGGRRRYNAARQRAAAARRHQVADLLLEAKSQADMARRFKVNRSTISRDVKVIGVWYAVVKARCPYCGQYYAGGKLFNRRTCPTLAVISGDSAA